jgi:peroxiredoxin
LNFNFQNNDKMPKKSNQLSFRPVFVISTIVLAAMLTLSGCKKQPVPKEAVEQAHTENDYNKPPPSTPVAESPNKAVALPQAEPKADIIAGPKAGPKINLRDIIRAARTWGPIYTSWFGQKTPDFTLTDINGKEHKLSDYRGKDVIIIFWATWCGPCKMEVPHLIALRNIIGEDKLAMLAISCISKFPPETTKKVKGFVGQNKINYTVFSVDGNTLPPPFNRINGIPCSFFIDPEGKIKLATEGLLSLGEIKAILQAE